MKIDQIKIGDRVRTSPGWLDDLQRSIEKLGVLQPIGVTPEFELIFGYRRLMACKALGMNDIPARVIDIDADDPATALRMEQAENNVRKDFTPSEKVEIARRIEEALGNRQGQRTDLPKNLGKSESPRGETADLAASAVGWSGEQYRKAKTVTQEAPEPVRSAMDSGEMSIHRAYQETRKPSKPGLISIHVRLRADRVNAEAKAMIASAGDELATQFAIAVLKECGHGVEATCAAKDES